MPVRYLPWAQVGVLLVVLATGRSSAVELKFQDTAVGISCAFYDVQLGIQWRAGKPEWLDADAKPQGPHALATLRITGGDTRRVQRIDLSASLRSWWGGDGGKYGFLLRTDSGGVMEFHSREATERELRPQLLLTMADGRRQFLEPLADATLDCSTYKGLGQVPVLSFSRNNTLALRFALPVGRAVTEVVAAELILVRTLVEAALPLAIGVFALDPPYTRGVAPRTDGLAAGFPGDRGLGRHPDVLFVEGFDAGKVDKRWNVGPRVPAEVIESDPRKAFEPLRGPALRVRVARREQLGLDYRYRFREHHGKEPEEIHFRYYLRLAADWLGAVEGGKLPGLAGTYGKAGWGGRRWDGNAGWSLRGGSGTAPPRDHPAAGHVFLSTYAYHARSDTYGESLPWADGDLAGLIPIDRWVCIEQRLRLNTPGRFDGEFMVWVDGRLALSRSDLRLRDRDDVRIEEIWMNVFHGGTAAAAADMHAYIDQIVVARRYIGPLAR